jgi:hypothetical protein
VSGRYQFLTDGRITFLVNASSHYDIGALTSERGLSLSWGLCAIPAPNGGICFISQTAGPSVAAEFFIDNVPQPLHDLIAHTYSFPVSAGSHTFLWLHHQDQQTLSGDIRVHLSLPASCSHNGERETLEKLTRVCSSLARFLAPDGGVQDHAPRHLDGRVHRLRVPSGLRRRWRTPPLHHLPRRDLHYEPEIHRGKPLSPQTPAGRVPVVSL